MRSKSINFCELITSGSFGGVTLGMTTDEVWEILPSPIIIEEQDEYSDYELCSHRDIIRVELSVVRLEKE